VATVGIIADIHGNREALDAVLEQLDRVGADKIVCLGDIVGYNAEPNRCVETISEMGIDSIAGNHDLIAIGELDDTRCSNKAAWALRQTRRRLTAESRDFLSALPRSRHYAEGFALIHGGVDDVQYYMRNIRDIEIHAALFQERFPGAGLCFFGHTHDQRAYRLVDGNVRTVPDDGGIVDLSGPGVCFINPGSVDASRKTDDERFAQYAILDVSRNALEFGRTTYDHHAAETRSEEEGYRMGPVLAKAWRLRRRLARHALQG